MAEIRSEEDRDKALAEGMTHLMVIHLHFGGSAERLTNIIQAAARQTAAVLADDPIAYLDSKERDNHVSRNGTLH